MKSKTINFQTISRGATILEVMISVLLLTFGVLALMAAQLRSVASIGEAENRSIISQAAEALAEGMQVNYTISSITAASGDSVYRRTYAEYTGKTGSISFASPSTLPTTLSGTQKTKADVATQQLNEFIETLKQLPNVSELHYAVCIDKPMPDVPELTTSFNAKCSATSDEDSVTMIKVAWRMGNANGTDSDKAGSTYTYMLEVSN